MNEEQIKGNWNQLKGKVQAKWGKLTDDEVEQFKGNRDQFIGTLQEKYGIEKEEAKKQYDDFIGQA
jgi:uncharacterized protein YjbJ (UPF0337 family)